MMLLFTAQSFIFLDLSQFQQIRDLGFGELFKSSDKVWDYRMEFSEENP